MSYSQDNHQIVLPYPPSVNHYWRTWKGRVLISEKGREYRKQIEKVFLANKYKTYRFVNDEKIKLFMLVEPPDKRRRDLDNVCKALLDALGHVKVYGDDSQICDLRIIRGHIKEHGCVTIEVDKIS